MANGVKVTAAVLGAKGGRVRAELLPAERRSEIARAGGLARWGERGDLPRAQYGSDDRPLQIGDLSIPCYVLEDGRRVLVGSGLMKSLDLSTGKGGVSRLAALVYKTSSTRQIYKALLEKINNPITFLLPGSTRTARGFEAAILPELCEAVLAARRDDLLSKNQEHVAERCEILLGGLARVGIIALVDEVTGYQEVRDRDDLARLLQRFIAKDLRPWARTFEPDFYKEIYRFHGWTWGKWGNHPAYVGKLTNEMVYDRLAPGLLDKLKKIVPRDAKGVTKHRFHQRLTEHHGYRQLREHLAATIALMKISKTKEEFLEHLDQVYPRLGNLLPAPTTTTSVETAS